jgi:hypothetical protein
MQDEWKSESIELELTIAYTCKRYARKRHTHKKYIYKRHVRERHVCEKYTPEHININKLVDELTGNVEGEKDNQLSGNNYKEKKWISDVNTTRGMLTRGTLTKDTLTRDMLPDGTFTRT